MAVAPRCSRKKEASCYHFQQVHSSATCNYVQECHNLILLGATGSGKTYLATAFGMAASRSFYTVKYVRLPELLGEPAIARGEGNYRKVIKACKFWGCRKTAAKRTEPRRLRKQPT